MNKRAMKKGLAIVLALVMVFAMSASAFAADVGKVNISITTGNFNLSGDYTGNGSPLTTITHPLTNRSITLEELSDYVGLYDIKGTFYLPAGTADPLPGQASVLDAVLAVLFEEGYDDIRTGWSSYSDPDNGYFPGGYINDFGGTNASNNVTYENRSDGYIWGRSTGWGWNIAYKPSGEAFRTTASDGYTHYMSDIPVASGMDIIIDLSQFNMEWNTGKRW